MEPRLYKSISGLAYDAFLDMPHMSRALPRVMNMPGIISDLDDDFEGPSSVCQERKIIVANRLPLNAHRDEDTSKLLFSWDEDSLLFQLKDGFLPDTEVIYVGLLQLEIKASEEEEVEKNLITKFNCVPVFLPSDLQRNFYHGFCKQQLWPLFHYMLPMYSNDGHRFNRKQWEAYVNVNIIFRNKVIGVFNPENDYVWVHDYHLMVLPTLLRRKFNRVKLGFFLHSPFPSSEIYRTLPVRIEILKGLLNCDLIGFHTFDYARHFLSCCSRLLGLEYESKRGHIGLDYFGRTIYIKILPVGIHTGRLESVLNLPETALRAKEIHEQFRNKKVILGIDDMDIFKGISLKMLAFEQLLGKHKRMRGQLVLVQIVNPARSSGKDVEEAKRETYSTVERINEIYGSDDYTPIVLIDRDVARFEKTAYYAVADCCIVNAVRDGMNLVPYKYIVCRQGTPFMDKEMGKKIDSPRTSMLVVSEFVGCSPSLSGAIRVNPWDIDAVKEAMCEAINMCEKEKILRHQKHYRYVSSHDVGYWARSFMQDLEKACKDHYNKRCWGIGLGFGFRVVALSPYFRKLSIDNTVSAYKSANRRAIFLDYDGTLVPQSGIVKSPCPQVLAALNTLCDDPRNIVFVVSGRGRNLLSEWFAPCQNLGIAAEHGYFTRWGSKSEWETTMSTTSLGWKEIVEPIMKSYTEATDGSNIEIKESGLVWHHLDADPAFGSCQSMELLDHLENVLAKEPAIVKRGKYIVEAKPQGVRKGLVAEKVLTTMANDGKPPDFVMCIGDDRSDEDMFESILSRFSSPSSPPEIFACTVGQKPSKAKYYLDDTNDVVQLLFGLANASNPKFTDSEFR